MYLISNLLIQISRKLRQFFSDRKVERINVRQIYRESRILSEQGKYDQVIQLWSKLKSQLPTQNEITNKCANGIKTKSEDEMKDQGSQEGTGNSITWQECDYQIAITHLMKGQSSEGVQLFKEYISNISGIQNYSEQTVGEECFQIALELQESSLYEEAIWFYEKAFQLNVQNLDIHLSYAHLLIKNLNKNQLAIQHIHELMKNPNYSSKQFLSILADAYFNLRDYQQSIDYNLAYLNSISHVQDPSLSQSAVHLKSWDNSQNEKEISNGLSQSDKKENATKLQEVEESGVYLKLASAYYFSNNLQKSLEFYQKCLSFQRQHGYDVSAQMFLNMAELYLKTGKIKESLSLLKEGNTQYPERVEFCYVAGMIHVNYTKNEIQAQEFLDAAIRIDEKHSDSHKQLGLLYLKQQKFELAENMFLKCITIYPNDTDALYYMAYILHYHHKVLQDAIICYQMCLDIKHDLLPPLLQIALIYNELGNHEKAMKYLNEAQQADPTSNEVQHVLQLVRSDQLKCKEYTPK